MPLTSPVILNMYDEANLFLQDYRFVSFKIQIVVGFLQLNMDHYQI